MHPLNRPVASRPGRPRSEATRSSPCFAHTMGVAEPFATRRRPAGGGEGRSPFNGRWDHFSSCPGRGPVSRSGCRRRNGLAQAHFCTTCFRPPPRAGYAVTAESEPRLPAKAGTRVGAHPTAPVGGSDELRRLSPRAVAVRLWNDRPGVTDDPPIHAYRRGGGSATAVVGATHGGACFCRSFEW